MVRYLSSLVLCIATPSDLSNFTWRVQKLHLVSASYARMSSSVRIAQTTFIPMALCCTGLLCLQHRQQLLSTLPAFSMCVYCVSWPVMFPHSKLSLVAEWRSHRGAVLGIFFGRFQAARVIRLSKAVETKWILFLFRCGFGLKGRDARRHQCDWRLWAAEAVQLRLESHRCLTCLF